jgi:hypothetical protein
VFFQKLGKDLIRIWLREICEYADFFETFRGAVYIGFATTKARGTPKTGLLRLCLFKQNNISKESCLKGRQQSRRERRNTSRCESVTWYQCQSHLYCFIWHASRENSDVYCFKSKRIQRVYIERYWEFQLFIFHVLIGDYLTIIRRRRGEYRWIKTETKSRFLFNDIHRAWGE